MTQTSQGKQHSLCKFLYFSMKKCGYAHNGHLVYKNKNHLDITNQPEECPVKLGFLFNCVND